MDTNYLKTSIVALLISNLWQAYDHFKLKITETYRHSQIYKMGSSFFKIIKAGFKYSLLGLVTETDKKDNLEIVSGSRIRIWLVSQYKILQGRLTYYLTVSKIYGLTKELKGIFYSYPVKASSIIIIINNIMNILFSILLKKEIGFLGWLIPGLFLFVGLNILSCNLNWQNLKETSFVIKSINTCCKERN